MKFFETNVFVKIENGIQLWHKKSKQTRDKTKENKKSSWNAE